MSVFWLSLVIVGLTTVFYSCVALFVICSAWLPKSILLIRNLIWMLPVGVLGGGAFQVLRSLATRTKHFRAIGAATIGQSAARAVVHVGGGLLGCGSAGLVAGYTLSQFVGLFSLAKRLKADICGVRRGSLHEVARVYRAFPLFNLWAALITNGGVGLPSIVLADRFSPGISGYFSLTVRVLGLPAGLLGQAIGQVFYPKVAEIENHSGDTYRLFERLTVGLIIVSTPVFTVIALHGPSLFGWIFGTQWSTAGLYSRYLAPMYAASFVAAPLSTMALIKGKQKAAFAITIAEASLRIGSIGVGAWWGSAALSVILYSLAGAVIYLGYTTWVFRLAGGRVLRLAGKLSLYFLSGIAVVACACGVVHVAPDSSHPGVIVITVMLLVGHTAWAWRHYAPEFALPSPWRRAR